MACTLYMEWIPIGATIVLIEGPRGTWSGAPGGTLAQEISTEAYQHIEGELVRAAARQLVSAGHPLEAVSGRATYYWEGRRLRAMQLLRGEDSLEETLEEKAAEIRAYRGPTVSVVATYFPGGQTALGAVTLRESQTEARAEALAAQL